MDSNCYKLSMDFKTKSTKGNLLILLFRIKKLIPSSFFKNTNKYKKNKNIKNSSTTRNY